MVVFSGPRYSDNHGVVFREDGVPIGVWRPFKSNETEEGLAEILSVSKEGREYLDRRGKAILKYGKRFTDPVLPTPPSSNVKVKVDDSLKSLVGHSGSCILWRKPSVEKCDCDRRKIIQKLDA